MRPTFWRPGTKLSLPYPCNFLPPRLYFPFPVPSMYAGDLIFLRAHARFPLRMNSRRSAICDAPLWCPSRLYFRVLPSISYPENSSPSTLLITASVANYLQLATPDRIYSSCDSPAVLNLTQQQGVNPSLIAPRTLMGARLTSFSVRVPLETRSGQPEPGVKPLETRPAQYPRRMSALRRGNFAPLDWKMTRSAGCYQEHLQDTAGVRVKRCKNRNDFLRIATGFKLATGVVNSSKHLFSSIIKKNSGGLRYKLSLSFSFLFFSFLPPEMITWCHGLAGNPGRRQPLRSINPETPFGLGIFPIRP